MCDKLELLIQIGVELLDEQAPVVPDGVVGRIEERRVLAQLERSLALLVQLEHSAKVVEHVPERVRVGYSYYVIRLVVLKSNAPALFFIFIFEILNEIKIILTW